MKYYKKRNGIIALLVVALIYTGCTEKMNIKKEEGRVEAKPTRTMYQADPTIFSFEGTYYLYGTNDESPNNGFQVYTSTNMISWHGPKGERSGLALVKGDAFGSQGFWAPQVWHANDKFYMAYTADEKIAIATSDSPLGPFVNDKNAISNDKQIDPFVFFDDDGKKYLYHVPVGAGNRIFVAELKDDFSGLKGTAQVCIAANDPWEIIHSRVVEGPTVLKHKGLYYLIYSANHFESQQYAVGYAVSEKPEGPWVKYSGNPILSIHNTREPGSGHGDMVTDKDGNMFYVFHTHNSSSQPTPRKTAIAPAKFVSKESGPDELVIDGDKFYHIKNKE